MATIVLNDRDAAEEIYATLLPHRKGPPAGAESMAVALRPVAHTLGELAVFLGRTHEAADHFAQAAAIADQWKAPHWAAEAPSRATTWPLPAAPHIHSVRRPDQGVRPSRRGCGGGGAARRSPALSLPKTSSGQVKRHARTR
ncbi:MAG TPA: hypothetical protein VFV01_00850 [Spirillospora sp.]|nr:hypothetical protein [Spirillospora sp.]